MATLPPQESRIPVTVNRFDDLLTALLNVLSNANRSLGREGGMPIYDTNEHVGNWCAIYCVTDTVFTADCVSNMLNLDFGTWPAGTWIYGVHTTIKLTSGTIVVYNN